MTIQKEDTAKTLVIRMNGPYPPPDLSNVVARKAKAAGIIHEIW